MPTLLNTVALHAGSREPNTSSDFKVREGASPLVNTVATETGSLVTLGRRGYSLSPGEDCLRETIVASSDLHGGGFFLLVITVVQQISP